MIKKLSFLTKKRNAEFLERCETDNIFGPRIASIYIAHGFNPDCDYFLADGDAKGIICRFYGTYYLALEAEHENDLAGVAKMFKNNCYWMALEGRYEKIAALSKLLMIDPPDSSYCMKYNGGKLPDISNFDIRKSDNLRTFYDILCVCHENFEESTNYKLWFGDYAARIGSGLTELYFLYRGGKPVSCVTVNAKSKSAGLIGSLSTLPEYRGRKYGSAICVRAVKSILAGNMIPTLQCVNDRMADFYQKLGFVTDGRWGIRDYL